MTVRPVPPPLAYLLGELTALAMLEILPRLVIAAVTGQRPKRWLL